MHSGLEIKLTGFKKADRNIELAKMGTAGSSLDVNTNNSCSKPGAVVISEITEGWCETKLNQTTLSYKWTIDNFSLRPEKNGEFLTTPEFSAAEMEQVKWSLKLYPKGCTNSIGYLAIFLKLASSDQPEVTASYSFSIINAYGKEGNTHERKAVKCFVRGTDKCVWGWAKFIALENLLDKEMGLLPDDRLTISCKVSIPDTFVVAGNSGLALGPTRKVLGLSEHVAKLYTSKRLCDVIITVGGRNFECHKAVLAARSPVFSAMFESHMKENKRALKFFPVLCKGNISNRISIFDITAEAFQEVLEFVYTERSFNIKVLAPELLAAADKFAMDDLKLLCEEVVIAGLNIQNAASRLILADRHSAPHLKAMTIKFIVKSFSSGSEITKTSGWKALQRSHPNLLLEVVQSIPDVIVICDVVSDGRMIV